MTPEPTFFWQFIAVVAVLASISANIITAMHGRRRDVKLLTDAVSPELFKEYRDMHDKHGHSQEFTSVRKEIVEAVNAISKASVDALNAVNKSGEERAEKIHGRINVILGGQKRIEGKLGIQPTPEEEMKA